MGNVPVMSANNNTIMKSTIEILSLLNETELTAVNAIIKAYISRPNKEKPFSTSLEQELYDMIDKALANADKGVCKDAEGFEKELLSESGE